MISFKINNIPTLFIKGYTPADTDTIVGFVRAVGEPTGDSVADSILFIDTPATLPTVAAVRKLKAEGYRVVFKDHHGIEAAPRNEVEKNREIAVSELRKLLGKDCNITVRSLHPACSTLVKVGEFKSALAIIADPDADGLTAAMKAAGLSYPELDEDAAKLDGQPSLQVTGTYISQLLAKGVATLPPTDPRRPESRDKAKSQLFSQWVLAVQGNSDALANLQKGESAYDAAIKLSQELAENAREVAPGVMLVDVMDKLGFDEGTLQVLLEQKPNCKITVVRKGIGPIAALNGVQYSLAVAKAFQPGLDIRDLLPSHFETGPEAGIISNVSFLLHVSQPVWEEQIMPAFKSLK